MTYDGDLASMQTGLRRRRCAVGVIGLAILFSAAPFAQTPPELPEPGALSPAIAELEEKNAKIGALLAAGDIYKDAEKSTFYLQEFVQPDDAILANSSVLTLYCYDRCLKGGLTQTDVDAASSDADLYYE